MSLFSLSDPKNISDISTISLFQYQVPLTQTIKFNGNQLSQRIGFIIKIIFSDNSVGLGEACPLPGFSIDSFDSCKKQLLALCQHLQANQKVSAKKANYQAITKLIAKLSPASRFAFDCALYQLQPLTDLSVLTTTPLIVSSSIEQAVSQYQALNCPPQIKLKVARHSPVQDAELIEALIKENNKLRLSLDANQGWQLAKAHQFIRALSPFAKQQIEIIEEPCSQLSDTIIFAEQSGLNIALDESIISLIHRSAKLGEAIAQIEQVLQSRYIKRLVIKPSLLGSISALIQLRELAKKSHCQLYLSSSFESSFAISQIAQLAGEISPNSPHGLDTLKFMKHNVLIELEQEKNTLTWADLECLWTA